MPTPTETEFNSRLEALDASLPTPPTPLGSYVPTVRTGNLVFTSGALPLKDGQLSSVGQLGTEAVSVAQGQEAAKLCILNCLSVIKAQVGSLKNIARIVKVTGFVSSTPDFYQQPAVINGASDFLVEIFGEKGKHARAAVGVAALPMNASVEIEMLVEIV